MSFEGDGWSFSPASARNASFVDFLQWKFDPYDSLV